VTFISFRALRSQRVVWAQSGPILTNPVFTLYKHDAAAWKLFDRTGAPGGGLCRGNSRLTESDGNREPRKPGTEFSDSTILDVLGFWGSSLSLRHDLLILS